MASPGKKPFLLRVDPDLWAEIERLAAAETAMTQPAFAMPAQRIASPMPSTAARHPIKMRLASIARLGQA